MTRKKGKFVINVAPDSDGGGTAVSSRTPKRGRFRETARARGPPKRHHLDRRAQAIAEILSEGDPERLMTTIETAELLGCSVSFLEIGRMRGYGPRKVVLSPKMVRYRRRDVLEWVQKRAAACAAQ